MKADAIVSRILDDARAEAARVLREAAERADLARQDAERRVEAQRAQLDEQTEREIGQRRGRMLRMAELEQRKALLGAKREVVEQVFETVLAALGSMPEDQRRAYNERLLLGAAEGGERLIHDAADAALFGDAFFDSVNGKLARAGKAPVRPSTERRDMGGGFVLAGEGVEIDCRYAAVLAQQVPGLEADVARMLFNAEVK